MLDDFDALYRKFGPMVLRRCRALLRDEESALDAMQDVFVRVYERRDRIATVCSSYLYAVATSVCLNRMRSDRSRYAPPLGELVDGIADSGFAHEDRVDARLLIEGIFGEEREDTRVMAVLHYLDGLTLEETAKEMSMSVSGVRKRLAGLRSRAIAGTGDAGGTYVGD